MALKLSFHGGVGTVTGSRYLLDANGRQVLVDAGLFQGLKELRLLNWKKPTFDAEAVDALLLTHGHIDHSGYLPRLARDGYRGPVFCTPGTRDLAEILLLDAAKLQEEDAAYANRQGFSKHRPALPLYTTADAETALGLFSAVPYGRWVDLGRSLRARFVNAGHILGSAIVELETAAGERTMTLVFSGDLGRYDAPLHPDPSPLPACDVLVMESTYGDRVHVPTPFAAQIREPMRRAFARGGVVLIPSFAVGRAQLVTLLLREAMEAGELPEVPIHIDSPMAVDATEVYARHVDEENLDRDVVGKGRHGLFPRQVHFHRTVEESKGLNRLGGARIIISSSGMLTGGRVVHHLKRLLPDERNLLVLVGYQAAGTRGRALLEGAKSLRMHGQDVRVAAEFLCIHGLSAHADQQELLRWVRSSDRPPGRVFLTHGEPEATRALADLLERDLGAGPVIPKMNESFDLAALAQNASG
jgi:metallo-beta-lactamase family protein